MNRLYSLDRMDENTAVLIAQDGREVPLPREMLSADAREGMLVYFCETMGLYCPDNSATQQRQEDLRQRMERLLHKTAK
jgi:hypothetical protein